MVLYDVCCLSIRAYLRVSEQYKSSLFFSLSLVEKSERKTNKTFWLKVSVKIEGVKPLLTDSTRDKSAQRDSCCVVIKDWVEKTAQSVSSWLGSEVTLNNFILITVGDHLKEAKWLKFVKISFIKALKVSQGSKSKTEIKKISLYSWIEMRK